jgi:HTH-type transcriptional regulator/antitoxin HigA
MIRTKTAYLAALSRAEKLMGAKPKTPRGDELELLALLIEDYEERIFPILKPDPIEAIRFRMSQQGLTNEDLVPIVGSRSCVSRVLSRRCPLSLKMIRLLVAKLRIPANLLIGEIERT